MKSISILFVGILMLFHSSLAIADSDGYYCFNTNYIAYEFDDRLSGKGEGHNLYIHFLSDNSPINSPKKVVLKRFQTHGMKCSEDTIVIGGWDTSYTISLKNTEELKVTNTQPISKGVLAGKNGSNLGLYSRDSVVSIKTTSLKYKYDLEMKTDMDNQVAEKGVIFWNKKTNLVRRAAGNPVDTYQIFKGSDIETVH